MSFMSDNFVSATRRAVPLCARRDLKLQRVDFQGLESWVVKDPLSLAYHRLLGEQYRLWQLLDGRRSLEDLQRQIRREFPAVDLPLIDIQALIADLYQRGLLQSSRAGRARSLLERDGGRRRRRILQILMNPLFIQIPGWDPARLLNFLDPLARWSFSMPAMLLGALLVMSSWGLMLLKFADFQRDVPAFTEFFGWQGMLSVWLTLGAAKIVHELAHGLACKHFGGECHEIGVAFLVFSPCLYCDVSDAWMLADKRHRILIGAAGMYVEALLSAVALLLWWCTNPGLVHFLSMNVFFVTTVTTVIFNANPLLRYDGYYMLADWLEIPNLRAKADELLKKTAAWYCLGSRLHAGGFEPRLGHVWFAGFAVASAFYRWFVALAMVWVLHGLLKPYGLQNVAWCLAALSVGTLLVRGVANIHSIVARSQRMIMARVVCTLSVLVIGLAATLFLPLPLRSKASFIIEPYQVRNVHTTVPGTLVEVCVEPGQRVRQGDVLARLADVEKERTRRRLVVDRERKRIESRIQHAVDDHAQQRYVDEIVDSIDKQLVDLEQQLARLTIVAPCSGKVIAPAVLAEPVLDPVQPKLHTWHGHPLERRNRGCFLEARTHLLSIAPDDRTQAVLLVDETDRENLAPGKAVELKFEHAPGKTIPGEVVQLADRNADFVPPALSNKNGGSLATATDPQGRERMAQAVYQAGALVIAADPQPLTGMRGEARFIVQNRTAAGWLWHYVKQTVHFRL